MSGTWEDFVSKKIVFVYNADSGVINMLKDYVHKIVSPSTYGCRLCSLIYDNRGVKDSWKEFVSQLHFRSQFLHRDEFVDKYGMKDDELPCVYMEKDGKLDLFIPASEIDQCNNLEELKSLVSGKLAGMLS